MTEAKRAVLLVLDGFGSGAMADAETEDRAAHTLGAIREHVGQPLDLPLFERLGLGNVTGGVGMDAVKTPEAAFGRAALGYPGADTFMGHQELMGGSLADVQRLLMEDMVVDVRSALEGAGHRVVPLDPERSALVVDGCVLIADNVEARPGLNVNVTASQDDVPFDDLTAIGRLVRATVPVPRVIVVGGRGFGIDEIRRHMMERTPEQYGVDTPSLGVYDEHYQVRHLGADIAYHRQVPMLARQAGLDVVLLGKAADVVRCDGALYENIVPTEEVLAATVQHLGEMQGGLIVANVQETDLAGHEQDADRFHRVLATVDRCLPQVIDRLRPHDLLLVAADHGNDPTIGHSQHTREYVPLLAIGPSVDPVDLNTRESLADVGATLAEFLELEPTEAGTSFLKEIV